MTAPRSFYHTNPCRTLLASAGLMMGRVPGSELSYPYSLIDWFDRDCCMRCVFGVNSVLFEMHEKSREFRNESENDSDNETDNKSDLDMTQHNRSTIIVEKDVQYEDEGWTSE